MGLSHGAISELPISATSVVSGSGNTNLFPTGLETAIEIGFIALVSETDVVGLEVAVQQGTATVNVSSGGGGGDGEWPMGMRQGAVYYY